jgi:hypothetical protein
MDWKKAETVGNAITPWTTLAGGVLGAAGAGLTAYEEEQRRKEEEEFRKKQFDWQQTMDKKGQFNTERQLGQNTLQSMRGSFKDAVYRALTKG